MKRGSRLALAAAVLAAALLGCDTRRHENPFDPRNPETQGVPAALEAVAGDGVVDLRWDPLGVEEVEGYRLWRWADGGDTISLSEGVLAPSVRSLRDTALANGTTYGYRLDFLAGPDTGARRSLPEVATPGPNRPWAIDAGSPPLVSLAADGRRVRERVGESGPYADLVVDQDDGGVWAADEFSAVLWRFDSAGELILHREGLAPVSRLALDGARQVLWALSRSARTLYALDEAAGVRDTLLLPGVGSLRDLDLDPTDGTVWVADGAGAVRHAASGTLLTSGPSLGFAPYAVAVDPLGRGLWITDAGYQLVHFFSPSPPSPAWSEYAFSGIRAPREVAARFHPVEHVQAWVADAAGAVVLLDKAAGILARVEGISSPRGLWVAPDGSCWLVAGGTGRVVHVDAAGVKRDDLAELVSPRQVVLWWRE